MSGPSAAVPTNGPAERLDSWKEIAAYFNRSLTTVQRWERDEGLPVHRHQHDALGSIYAYKHELEAWRSQRAVLADAEEPSKAAVTPAEVATPPAPVSLLPPARSWPIAQGVVVALGVAVLGGVIVAVIGQRSAAVNLPKPMRRVAVVLSNTTPMVLSGTDRSLTITSDGSRIVYVGGSGGSRLFVRSLDQLDATVIAGVGSPRYPFTSPDGNWIGFFDRNTLKKVRMTGGPATTLVDGTILPQDDKSGAGNPSTYAGRRAGSRGAAWGLHNQIVYGLEGRIMRISADGGPSEVLASPDPAKGESIYSWPEYLPGDAGILFTVVPVGDWSEQGSKSSVEHAQVAVFDFRTRQKRVLLEGGSHAHYTDSGHLVYASGGAIKAVPFDLRTLEIVGSPKIVVPQVATTIRGAANFDVAGDGTLIYAFGSIENDLVTLTWVDRHGREEAVDAPSFVYRHPRLSPDGRRIAIDSLRDLGIWDLSAKTLSWFGVGPSSQVVWSPDGKRLIFSSTRTGQALIRSQSIDSSQAARSLVDSPHNQFPNAISPDGNQLILRDDGATPDLMVLDLRGRSGPEPFIRTPSRELNADFSPDGRFVTYQSTESGQDEVYVQPFPIVVGGRRWTISSGGGRQPLWSPNGQELFYLSPDDAVMSVAVQRRGDALTPGTPAKLFAGPYYFGFGSMSGRTYDVSPIDQRFLMMKPVRGDTIRSTTEIDVVLNWFEELERTVRK